MDLKSMLNNDAAAHKTPETPSQPVFDQPLQTPSRTGSSLPNEHHHVDRPSPYPPPLRPPDQRTSTGSHFAPPSPYQNHSSATPTWSAGGRSIHSQSPGTHGNLFSPRDGTSHQPYSSSFIPPPSPLAPQPPTSGPITQHHQTYSSQSAQFNSPPPPSHSSSGPSVSRETSLSLNGVQVSQPRHAMHNLQSPLQPATPLGPPAQFQRPSPQAQRPLSQGHEHYRTYSSGSIGSAQGREFGPSHLASPQQIRRESLQRQYSLERERSISVSPKTIPRPSPQPQINENRWQPQVTPPATHPIEAEQAASHLNPVADAQGDLLHAASTPQSASQTPKDLHVTPVTNSELPSPAPASQILTPKSTHTSLPASQSPQIQNKPTLKRNASLVSAASNSSLPVRKRLKRGDIPIFAQSARQGRPLRLIGAPAQAAPAKVTPAQVIPRSDEPEPPHQQANGRRQSVDPLQELAPHWEPSITNLQPYEDLSRRVCDWISQHVGSGPAPSGGAMFEIEAKIGEIFDVEEGTRIRLPVETEAVFNKDLYRRTKFESSMNMEQHKQLNEFLNGLVREAHEQSLVSDRTPIYFDHPREFDEFFELKPIGMSNLPQSITQWLNPRHRPRVRRTMDLKTNKIKAQIIKSRIADLDVYNPGSDFDYRISVSIESPWQGEMGWLEPMTDGGRERNKDRMSYRHMAYQIDLTQVSYTSRPDKEHELEVEISTEQVRKELENLRMHRENRYEQLVQGFVDNVRILCRKGTVMRK